MRVFPPYTYIPFDANDKATITDIFGDFTGNYIVPNTLDDKTVAVIGSQVFKNCIGIISVVIPSNVTTIGQDAFSGCSSLTDFYYLRTSENYSSAGIPETTRIWLCDNYSGVNISKIDHKDAFNEEVTILEIIGTNNVTTIGNNYTIEGSIPIAGKFIYNHAWSEWTQEENTFKCTATKVCKKDTQGEIEEGTVVNKVDRSTNLYRNGT